MVPNLVQGLLLKIQYWCGGLFKDCFTKMTKQNEPKHSKRSGKFMEMDELQIIIMIIDNYNPPTCYLFELVAEEQNGRS